MSKKYKDEWMKLGENILSGKYVLKTIKFRDTVYTLSKEQSDFICDMDGKRNKFVLFSGGRGAGKSLALCMKMALFAKCFPGIRILLGRKNISDIEKTTLQDLFRLLPPSWYEHRVKDGLINFQNGSQIILFGLDAMQSGNVMELKKAQQKTKSLNIGAFFIDQLEEIDYEVFQSLNDTMRMTAPSGQMDYPRQGNMTTNPANFWGYHFFKLNERMTEDGFWVPKSESNSRLIEVSMLSNKDNLPEDFVRDRMNREESYVRRFVHGEWTMDNLTKGAVFAREHIKELESNLKTPLRVEEGCEIYEDPSPGMEYRMGVDPSEGVVDPSSISVVSSNGRKVAKFNGKLPIIGLADKVKFLYYKYGKPLIIPESNAAGAALIREIRDLKVYRRKQMDYKEDRETEKLGFRMSWESKQQLITHFQRLLREKRVKIFDRKTIEEMKSFIWNDEATQQGAGAQRGFHDDEVMSTLLAYWDFNPDRMMQIQIQKAAPKPKRVFQYS